MVLPFPMSSPPRSPPPNFHPPQFHNFDNSNFSFDVANRETTTTAAFCAVRAIADDVVCLFVAVVDSGRLVALVVRVADVALPTVVARLVVALASRSGALEELERLFRSVFRFLAAVSN